MKEIPATDRRTAGWIAGLLFVLLVLPLGFWGLGSTDAVSMEGIIVDGARTMVESGNYWVPRLHGEIYSYKPPLTYWMSIASSRLLGGESELSLRLPFVLSGLLMALCVFGVVAGRFGPWIGCLSGLASITGVLTLQKLRLAEFDTPLAAGVGVAVILGTWALTSERRAYALWQATYLALALGFLAKGIPAIMFFGPGLLLAAYWTRAWRRLFGLPHIAGGLTFCAVVAFWIAAAWQSDGWAAFAQPFEEADDKGLSWDTEALAATLIKPLVLIGCFFPWTLLLPSAVSALRSKELDPRLKGLMQASAGFVVAGLAVFMAVPATQNRYLLPLAVPAGLLCVLALLAEPKRAGKIARYTAMVLGGLVALAAPVLAFQGKWDLEPAQASVIFLGAALVFGLGWRYPRIQKPDVVKSAALMVAVAVGVGALQMGVVGPYRASSRSLQSVADSFAAHLAADETVWVGPVSKHFRHSSLFFYLQRPVKTFDLGEGPPPGAAVVLFSDEPPGTDSILDFDHRKLEQLERRGRDFWLLRVAEKSKKADGP